MFPTLPQATRCVAEFSNEESKVSKLRWGRVIKDTNRISGDCIFDRPLLHQHDCTSLAFRTTISVIGLIKCLRPDGRTGQDPAVQSYRKNRVWISSRTKPDRARGRKQIPGRAEKHT